MEIELVDEPTHCTKDPDTKFVPSTVRLKLAPPAVALVGEIELTVGLVELFNRPTWLWLVPGANAIKPSVTNTMLRIDLRSDFNIATPFPTHGFERKF